MFDLSYTKINFDIYFLILCFELLTNQQLSFDLFSHLHGARLFLCASRSAHVCTSKELVSMIWLKSLSI